MQYLSLLSVAGVQSGLGAGCAGGSERMEWWADVPLTLAPGGGTLG